MEYYKLVIKGNCPYCVEAVSVLESQGVDFLYTDMQQFDYVLKEIQNDINHHTVPMVWKISIDEDGNQTVRFIGGCDNLKEHFGV